MSTATATRTFFRNPAPVKKPARKSGRDPLPDAQVNEYRAGLKPDQVKKLHAFIKQAAALGGYQNPPRENGPLWEKYERQILEDWICHEVDVDELEAPQP